MSDVRNVVAPNLPVAPLQYDRQWHDQLNNTLRLYFATLNNAVNEALKVPKDKLELTDGVTVPLTTGGRALLYVDSTDGDLKIKFSDGTVKTIITD